MDSSKSLRDHWCLALAGGLGLAGAALLTLAKPITITLPSRPYATSSEVRLPARDTPAVAAAPDAIRPRPSRSPLPLARTWIAPPVPDATPARTAPAVVSAVTAPPEDVAAPPPRVGALAGVLRASGLACLGGRERLLSTAERELCREKLGALSGASPSLPAPITPAERADYDAVARAQAPRRAPVPLSARGAGNPFAFDDRARRRPRVGCALRFGLDADPAPGRCFLLPLAASSTAEVDPRRSY